ncbi:MAG: triose-phosphate isomerase [Planctomycetota bacterium]|nr:MAG: triose-phosphate isomerase [Planctomycetota bacterium]
MSFRLSRDPCRSCRTVSDSPSRKPYLAANWKMNLDRSKALDLIKTLKARLGDGDDREVAVFPPSIYLADVAAVSQGSPIGLGAQNMHWEESGAFTGEISALMLRGIGVERVLIGHSERRHLFGEKDEWMGRKVRAALDQDLLPMLCIGETLEERESGKMNEVLTRQLKTGLEWIKGAEISRVTLAYEPVWAIGTGVTASSEQAQEAHVFIRKWLREQHGEDAAAQLRILYGGSVKPSNVKELMSNPDVDGVLVGGASLSADSFLPIVEFDS